MIDLSELSIVKPSGKSARDNDGLHKRRGIWYYCLTIDGQRRFFSAQTRNYQQARRKRADAIKAQQENRLPTDYARWPFETLLAQVIEDRKPHLSENSIRIDKERFVPLLRAFRGKRICEIDARAIKNYQQARQKEVGNRAINLETKLLRQVLKAAKVWSQVADDYKPLPVNSRGPGRALEPNQEKLLFDTARENPRWDAAFYAALAASNTTNRSFELKGLHLEDVDLMNREIIIRKSKTNAGERRIPLNAAALWAFARLVQRANALGSAEPCHFLFPHFRYRRTKETAKSAGLGYDPERPQKTWRTACVHLSRRPQNALESRRQQKR